MNNQFNNRGYNISIIQNISYLHHDWSVCRFVAVTTMDIEFERLDMNQCPLAEGNPAPNYFAGTARCRPTTMVRLQARPPGFLSLSVVFTLRTSLSGTFGYRKPVLEVFALFYVYACPFCRVGDVRLLLCVWHVFITL